MTDTDSSQPVDSLRAWASALQGKTQAGKAGPATWAGATLRLLMVDVARRQVATDVAFEDALIARWRRLGLLQGTAAPRGAETLPSLKGGAGGQAGGGLSDRKLADPIKRQWWPWAAVPLLVVGVASLLLWPGRALIEPAEYPADAGTLRGPDGPQLITTADPANLADAVEQALLRHQVPTRRLALAASAVQLQAKLTPEQSALAAELRALGVSVPAHGRLNLVIQLAPKSP